MLLVTGNCGCNILFFDFVFFHLKISSVVLNNWKQCLRYHEKVMLMMMAMMRQESLPDRYSFECLSADGVKFFFIIVENT